MQNGQTDKDLGAAVRNHLIEKGIETPLFRKFDPDLHELEHSFIELMECIGLDLSDDSMGDTPSRLAKMFGREIFYGLNYDNFPCCTIVRNKMGYKELVICDDIEVASMCEHHFLPFVGKAAVGYLPAEGVLGLSKLNRIVDFFCRRPQIQERLTEQISATLAFVLGTADIAVVIRADHSCVRLRGVKDSHSSTLTSRMMGKFLGEPAWSPNALRDEFLHLARIK